MCNFVILWGLVRENYVARYKYVYKKMMRRKYSVYAYLDLKK